jgi:hypothetical protein
MVCHTLATMAMDFGEFVRFDGIYHSLGWLIEKSCVIGAPLNLGTVKISPVINPQELS